MPNGPVREDNAWPGPARTAASPEAGGPAGGTPAAITCFPSLSRLGTDQSPGLTLPTALATAPASSDRFIT